MLRAVKMQRTAVAKRFKSFPVAQGFLRDIVQAQEDGTLTSFEAAQWLLEEALKKPVLEFHTASRTTFVTKRKMAIDREDNSRLLLNWMVKFRGLRPETARQYVLRLQKLRKGGLLNTSSVLEMIDKIQENPSDWQNADQCLAALNLVKEYYDE